MKRLLFVTLSALLCSCLLAQTRMIVMSDIGGSDPDDTQSMVHLLVSLDRVELEGFISQHAWVPYGNGAVTLINQVIDAYEEVYPNLQVHSNKFPTASYLRSVVKVGQAEAAMHGVGEGKDSEGSEWLIKTIDKDDERPIWITAWSGLNTLAQALWKVSHTRTAEQVERFVSKVRVYDVLGQDDAGAWIVKTIPTSSISAIRRFMDGHRPMSGFVKTYKRLDPWENAILIVSGPQKVILRHLCIV